jgi:hypothetical protein
MKRKGPFHAHAVGCDTPYCETGVRPALAQAHHSTLEDLSSSLAALEDQSVYSDQITRAQLGQFLLAFQLLLLDRCY